MDPEQRNQVYLWGCCIYSPSPLNLNDQPGVLWLLFGESVNKKKKKNWSNLATLWELLYGFLHESKGIKLLELLYNVVTFPKSVLFKSKCTSPWSLHESIMGMKEFKWEPSINIQTKVKVKKNYLGHKERSRFKFWNVKNLRTTVGTFESHLVFKYNI